MRSIEQLARAAYAAYCLQAASLTSINKPLPSFDEMGAERQSCWIAAVQAVRKEIEAVH